MGTVFSTAGEIVQDAFEELGLFRATEPVDPDNMATGIRRLNLLLDEMSINRSLIFARVEDGPLATVGGTNGYAIGAGLTWNTVRPITIEHGFIRINGQDFPIDCTMTEEVYNLTVADKSTQAQPSRLFYKRGASSGIVYFDTVPDTEYAVYLFSHKAFTKFTDQSSSVEWPDGYESALMLNLAARLGPRYGKNADPATIALAQEAAMKLKSTYRERRNADFSDVPGMGRGRAFNIITRE